MSDGETLDGVTPTIADVMSAAIASRMLDVHVALPAKVEAYDAAAQTVDVVPAIKRAIRNRAGEKVLEDLPKIAGVPVAWPRGGGMFVHLPITAGDFVLLVFCERNIGRFREVGDVVDPGDQRMHGLSGAVAIPGFYPNAKALAAGDAGDGDLALGKESGPQIRVTESDVLLGDKTATDLVALKSLVEAEFTAIKATLATGSNTGGPVVFGTPYTGPGNVGAMKVRAK